MKTFNLKQNNCSLLPILKWGKDYDRDWLKPDIIAGITLGVFTIPEAIAYDLWQDYIQKQVYMWL